jgi:hypothetical protein
MLDKGPLKATHIDLQVINAPKLAQSQSLGLQAKDWEILKNGGRLNWI